MTATNGAARRGEASCTARATSSLPVPVSPKISTVLMVSATWLISSKTSCIRGLLLRMLWKANCSCSFSRSAATSSCERRSRRRALDHQPQMLEVDRLGQEIGGTHSHRLHGVVDRAESRGDDDVGRQPSLLHLFEQLQTVDPRHLQVGDDDAVGTLVECLERFASVGRRVDRDVRIGLEENLDLLAGRFVVFDDQDAPFEPEPVRGGLARGRAGAVRSWPVRYSRLLADSRDLSPSSIY